MLIAYHADVLAIIATIAKAQERELRKKLRVTNDILPSDKLARRATRISLRSYLKDIFDTIYLNVISSTIMRLSNNSESPQVLDDDDDKSAFFSKVLIASRCTRSYIQK